VFLTTCSTSVQIGKKNWAQKLFVSRAQTYLYEPIFKLGRILGDGLTFIYLWIAISSQILGVRLCMFPRSKCKVLGSLGRNPCPGLSPDAFVAVIPISLFDQFPGFFRKFLMVSTFRNFISSSILGDGVCMSTWRQSNIYCSVWNTLCQIWISGVLVLEGPASLSV
jgi:hypothetical protein